jgi:hypothetical protein
MSMADAMRFLRQRRVVVTTLGITQTLAWGSTYYLPAVMVDPICKSLHLSASWFFGLYEAAFVTATGLYGRDARSAITGITLFAGFASTIGWPASAVFIHEFGWRGACLTWAILHLVLGLPLNRLLVPKALPAVIEIVQPGQTPVKMPPTMVLLAGVFAACWFVSVAMATNLPRLLEALGATPAAAVAAAALVGPAQVGARLIEFSLLRHASPLVSTRLAAALHPIGAVLLVVVGAPAAALFTILHGGGAGLLTIARGTLPLALYGANGYGLRTGQLAAPGRILQGGAPLLFSLVLDRAGPGCALLLTGTLSSAAFIALLFVRQPSRELKASLVTW